MFPVIAFSMAFLLNFIAIYYGSMIAIPFTSMLTVCMIWLAVSSPLVVLGTLVGRSCTKPNDFPVRISSVRRPIPDTPVWTRPIVLAAIGGVLPFASIFMEVRIRRLMFASIDALMC